MLAMLLLLFAGLMALGVPIAFSMGIASATFFTVNGNGLVQFAQRVVAGADSFTILAIPFFMLSGDIMGKGGVSRRILRFANALIGFVRGGLAVTSVVSCALFGAICGSAPATAVAVGGIMAPDMVKRGYKKSFTATIFGVGGCLGLIIPPSLVMVMLGSTGGISIGDLFLGGFIPGIIMTALLCIYCVQQSKKHNYGIEGGETVFDLRELGLSFVDALLPLTIPIFILGSITFGIATPTEAAVISVVWSMVLSMLVYREISIKEMVQIFSNASVTAAGVTAIMAAASALSWALAVENIPATVSTFFMRYVDNQLLFFLCVYVIVFFLGCVTEAVSIIVILTPILMPVSNQLGIDPIHFGLFMTMVLTIGAVTPPVGLSMIAAGKVIGVKIEDTFPEIVHCLVIMTIVTVLVALFPGLSTWLPRTLSALAQ